MIRQLNREQIEASKSSWPCYGFPEELDGLTCYFENGDLVDLEAYDANDRPLDTSEFDESALVALVEDCKKFGQKFSNP